MSVTKKQIGELVKSILEANHSTSQTKFDERIVWKMVDIARDYLITRAYWNARKDSSYTLNDEFISSLSATVKKDEERNLFYLSLPARIVSLPDDRGLVQVLPKKNENIQFVRIKAGSNAVYANLEAGQIGGKTGYWLEGQKIWFKNLPPQFGSVELLIKLILGADYFDIDDVLPIPSDYQAELLQLVLQFISGEKQIEQDRAVDKQAL